MENNSFKQLYSLNVTEIPTKKGAKLLEKPKVRKILIIKGR